MKEKPYIKIWSFYDAPEEYQNLSTNGGDEDWLVFIPAAFSDQEPSFLQQSRSFGCCCVDEYEVEGGKILIAAHA